uniref:Secreted protein n=1 Tax=Panagrellus redivivus TaxID=6233 RepID=A0A7E4VL43_PANRE
MTSRRRHTVSVATRVCAIYLRYLRAIERGIAHLSPPTLLLTIPLLAPSTMTAPALIQFGARSTLNMPKFSVLVIDKNGSSTLDDITA